MTRKAPPVKLSEPSPCVTRRFRVIVAEDDADMRSLIAGALRKDGFEVSEVADGAKLLIEIVSRPVASIPDLVISDVRIPVSSGLQVLRGLRKAGVSIPFILVTAFGDAPTRQEVEGLGATYLEKPFELEVLRTTVRRCLGEGAQASAEAIP